MMKKTLFICQLLFTLGAFAQEATTTSPWTFGIGTNFIDNTVRANQQYFNTKQWNGGQIFSTFSVSYAYDAYWALSLETNITRIDPAVMQNGGYLPADKIAVAFDLNAQYFFDTHLFDLKKFDAALVAGLGHYWYDGHGYASFNTGAMFQYWILEPLGIRLQSLAKFAFNQNPGLNNHLLHQVTVVFKF